MGSYTDNFGMFVKTGVDTGRSISDGGSYCEGGMTESLVLEINLVDLTETESVQNDVLFIPANARIMGFELEGEENAATGVAIDIGTLAASRDTGDTAYTADPNGIAVAVVTAELTAGSYYKVWGTVANELPAFASTGAWGDDLGTIATVDRLITASRTTATAFTAGKVRLRVHYLSESAASNEFQSGLSLAEAQDGSAL